jgi:hypothetical protein
MKQYLCLACVAVGLSFPPLVVLAQEATLGEEPAPDSVLGLHGPFARAFQERVRAETMFPCLKNALEKQDPFWSETEAVLKARTYFFDRERSDGTQSEAWAFGGMVDVRSGWFQEWLSIGLGYAQSEKVSGDRDKDGTLLLAPGQQGFEVLAKAYATLQYGDHKAVLYRQDLNLPYVNRQHSRMIPNTFEAYKAAGHWDNVPAAGRIRYLLGYVDSIKGRNADTFTSMSRAAGASGGDRGLVMSGIAIEPTEDILLGAINHFVDDSLNIFYSEADWKLDRADELGIRAQLQHTHQQSVGEDRLGEGEFETQVLGARLSTSLKGLLLKAAVSTTDSEAAIRSPFGSYPGFISLMQKDFNRAGEDAWLLGAVYSLDRVGLDGVRLVVNYAEGVDAQDAAGALPDEREFNVTADWRPEKGFLKNIWLRVRWSALDLEGESRNTDEFRVVLNYEIPIL